VTLAYIALVLLVVAVAAVLTFLVRRRTGDVTPGQGYAVYGFVTTLYALVLGFVLVVALQTYQSAGQQADQEADAVVSLSRLATAFPASQRDDLEHALVCYARGTISYEWPAMRDGHASDIAGAASDRLALAYARLAGTPSGGNAALGSSLDQLQALEEARSSRLRIGSSGLPSLFWVFLIAGGALVVALSAIFTARDTTLVEIGLMGTMLLMVVVAVYLVGAFSSPFSGTSPSVDPGAMRDALTSVVRFAPDPETARPCP
jgi:Protein of unknown function (DUF4239)